MCIVTDRRKATGQAVTCWFVFTVAVLKLLLPYHEITFTCSRMPLQSDEK